MYLALRTRPDIFFSVSYLAIRVADPSNQDASKLKRKRIFDYISSSADIALVLRCRIRNWRGHLRLQVEEAAARL
jgi:hypothetical protein